jgi:hypothetical protein
VKEFEAIIENQRKDAAEAALARDSATDEFQREVYDRLYEHFTWLADEVEQAMKSAMERCQAERAMTIGADSGTLAIVILPKEKGDPTFKVCLMGLNQDSEIDWDARSFVLTRMAGIDGAKTYSMDLADLLRMGVIQLGYQ